jgi:hypothetical protein
VNLREQQMAEELEPQPLVRQKSGFHQPSLGRTTSRTKANPVDAIPAQPATLGRSISREIAVNSRVAIVGLEEIELGSKGFEVQIEFDKQDDFQEIVQAKAEEMGMMMSDLDESYIKVVKKDGEEMGPMDDGEDIFPITFKFEPPKESIKANGQMGMCIELDDTENLDWKVTLDNGTDVVVNRRNLAPITGGKAVEEKQLVALVGLHDDPQLNGKIAVVEKPFEEGKWIVKLPDDTEMTVSATNLVPVDEKSSFGEAIEIKFEKALTCADAGSVQLLQCAPIGELKKAAKKLTGQNMLALSFGDDALPSHKTLQEAGLTNGSVVQIAFLTTSTELFTILGEDLINNQREHLETSQHLEGVEVVMCLYTAAW